MAEDAAGHPRTALVTGAAGFIGYHVSQSLLAQGWHVVGVDNLNSYYDVSLKTRRVEQLATHPSFRSETFSIETPNALAHLVETTRPEAIIHLAAQAGVRYSIEAPESYVDSNLIGTFRLLEAARAYPPHHMLLASTSSVYGANPDLPYRETDKADHQMSFYAATKKANEAMAHSYAHLYGIPTTMFRFFTVYGPWGRPDMALFKFTRAILENRPIDIYNNGAMQRDFTYIDDLIQAVISLIDCAPKRPAPDQNIPAHDSQSPVGPFRVVNIGNSEPVALMDFIEAIEDATGKVAEKNFMPMQPGDVPATWAQTELLQDLVPGMAHTSVREGVVQFVAWYRDYYRL